MGTSLSRGTRRNQEVHVMARTLTFLRDGTPVAFELGSKIDKKALYGFAKTVAERGGTPLSRGYLTPDGALLRRDVLSLVKVDPEGSLIEEPQTLIHGEPAELQPSSFEHQAPLEGVPLARLVGFETRDVYPLDGGALPVGLYKTAFSYRKAFQMQEAFILVREDATFLLVGAQKLTSFVGQTVAYDFFDTDSGDAADADSDELDFSMV